MMKVDISVMTAEMPETVNKEYRYCSLSEKVDDYMLYCESDEHSEYHWKYLKALYRKLRNCKRRHTKEQIEILDKLTQFFIKYAGYDSGEDQIDIPGQDLFKYHKGYEDV